MSVTHDTVITVYTGENFGGIETLSDELSEWESEGELLVAIEDFEDREGVHVRIIEQFIAKGDAEELVKRKLPCLAPFLP